MKVYYELNLSNFEGWCGGEDTLRRILDNGKEDEFMAVLEDCYPDGMTATELNDLLRFDADWCYESVGLETETELRERLEEVESSIEDCEERIGELETTIKESDDEEEVDELMEELESVKEELREYELELDELEDALGEF